MTPDERNDRLHHVLESHVLAQPGADVDLLAHHIRRHRQLAGITEDEVKRCVGSSPFMVGRPDGGVLHLSEVFEGSILTQRVRASTAGRTDLWTTLALAPFMMLARSAPLPLATAGALRASEFGHPALVGPPGWLPEVRAWEVVALQLTDGSIRATAVAEERLGDALRHQRAKELTAFHYRRERWFRGTDDLESRPAELVSAISSALLEDPHLFAQPLPPLDELLHDALEEQHHHHWRRAEAYRQVPSVDFTIRAMPEALQTELDARARRFGMSLDQYVIAVLGHLAWRTPFAEDLQPWEDWYPDSTRPA